MISIIIIMMIRIVRIMFITMARDNDDDNTFIKIQMYKSKRRHDEMHLAKLCTLISVIATGESLLLRLVLMQLWL